MSYIVIDQGTSSTKAFVFSNKGKILHQKKIKYKLERPKPFHIECNPKTILDDIVCLFNEMVTKENNKNIRPKYPFLRSILIKLEECLVIKKNTLMKLAITEIETSKKEKNDFLVSKFDLINTWQGILLYFFILVLTIFILKRYFISNVNVIEIHNIEKKIIEK